MTHFILVVFVILLAAPVSAIPLVPDDFEDGTTEGWLVPDPSHPAPPAVVPSGGPAGAGDAYLQLTALGGDGPGSRLSVLNFSQWTEDLSGISGISMDVNNFGPADVVLRLLFVNFPDAPGPPLAVAWTLAPVAVPALSGWTSVFFDLSAGNLFAPLGTVALALGDVDELRIFHSVAPAFGGPGIGAEPVQAVVGLDNIQAVPEPSTMLLVMSGLAAARLRQTRKPKPQRT